MGHFGVVGAGEAGDRVEQDHHVLAEFDEPLGLLDHHLGDLHMAAAGFVEGAADDLGLGVPLHVGHFFRPFVDQEDDQDRLGVVDADAVGDLLQQHRLAGARRGDNEHALALADRRDQIADAHVEIFRIRLQAEPGVGVQRRKILEVAGVGDALGVFAVDRLDAEQGEISLGFLGRADLALDDMAVAKAETADLARADVDVVRAGQIVVFRRAEESETVGEDFEHAFAIHQTVLADAAAEDLENQILLLEPDIILDALFAGDLVEAGDFHLLEVFDVELAALDLFVAGVGLGVEVTDILGRLRFGGALRRPLLLWTFLLGALGLPFRGTGLAVGLFLPFVAVAAGPVPATSLPAVALIATAVTAPIRVAVAAFFIPIVPLAPFIPLGARFRSRFFLRSGHGFAFRLGFGDGSFFRDGGGRLLDRFVRGFSVGGFGLALAGGGLCHGMASG